MAAPATRVPVERSRFRCVSSRRRRICDRIRAVFAETGAATVGLGFFLEADFFAVPFFATVPFLPTELLRAADLLLAVTLRDFGAALDVADTRAERPFSVAGTFDLADFDSDFVLPLAATLGLIDFAAVADLRRSRR